jgi:hypothetical protein
MFGRDADKPHKSVDDQWPGWAALIVAASMLLALVLLSA